MRKLDFGMTLAVPLLFPRLSTTWLSVLLCTVALDAASADQLNLTHGSWEVTDFDRSFSLSADGQHEIESGGGGPNTARVCMTGGALGSTSLYPGLKAFPRVAQHCKLTTISETPNLIDSVVECSAYGGLGPHITHTIVSALTPKSFITVQEETFLEPNYDGRISRSAAYKRGRWLKADCDR